MAERRVVPPDQLRYNQPPVEPQYSERAYNIARAMQLLRPQMRVATTMMEQQRMHFERESSIRALVKNVVEDLISSVFKSGVGTLPQTMEYYQNHFQYHHATIAMKTRLRDIVRDFTLLDNAADLERRVRSAARILTSFITYLESERTHAGPSAMYDREILRLAQQGPAHGRTAFETEQELRQAMPYHEYFDLVQENREQFGERLVWDMDWNNLQLNVGWMLPDTMEAEELSFEDTAELVAMDDESD